MRFEKQRKVHKDVGLRMSSGRNEVEQSMYPVVAEAWITLDTRLLGQDVVVLAFEVVHDFLKANKEFIDGENGIRGKNLRVLVVNIVSKSWRINNSEGDTNAIFLKFCVIQS